MGKNPVKNSLQDRSIYRSSAGDNPAVESLSDAIREQVSDFDIHQQRIPVFAGRSESTVDDDINRAGCSVIHAVFSV